MEQLLEDSSVPARHIERNFNIDGSSLSNHGIGDPMIQVRINVAMMLVGLDGKEKKRFWEALDEVVRDMPSSEKIMVAGDFNGHIGVLPGGYGDVHGRYCFWEKNDQGVALLDFVRSFGMAVMNSSFPKKEDHLTKRNS
ncbi:uncharacterized protein LOC124896252 [Capsicum annuum]|uniref:uncharacterized protein LOC124896252 n=1 Tax=Capsicum annuum TaxID=4072 RepID=UPI001FB04FBF|nr:uncharacterized protein LOC124896252 [Capsicum annuum]